MTLNAIFIVAFQKDFSKITNQIIMVLQYYDINWSYICSSMSAILYGYLVSLDNHMHNVMLNFSMIFSHIWEILRHNRSRS